MKTETETKKSSFVFILSNIDVTGDLPVEVAPKHYFQKANDEQIKIIKERIFLSFHGFSPIRKGGLIPYENHATEVMGNKPGFYRLEYKKLPKDKWKYWVINFEGTNSEIFKISQAASILENDFELGFIFLAIPKIDNYGFMWHPSISSFFEDVSIFGQSFNVHSDEIKQINKYYSLINKIDSKDIYIKNSLDRFVNLKALPRNSEMMVIGLFSIIESLITHNPQIKDLPDSLRHQISTKLPLLFRRSSYKINHAKYFGSEEIEKILASIYQYRSSIVHGEKTDFRSNTFRILRNIETVLKYLKEIVKLLLIFALNEPAFITDLKKC